MLFRSSLVSLFCVLFSGIFRAAERPGFIRRGPRLRSLFLAVLSCLLTLLHLYLYLSVNDVRIYVSKVSTNAQTNFPPCVRLRGCADSLLAPLTPVFVFVVPVSSWHACFPVRNLWVFASARLLVVNTNHASKQKKANCLCVCVRVQNGFSPAGSDICLEETVRVSVTGARL